MRWYVHCMQDYLLHVLHVLLENEDFIIIIIIIKKYWQCKAGRGRLTPFESADPSPTLPTYRGKEDKGKIVEDKKGESNYANKKALDLLLKPHHQIRGPPDRSREILRRE